MSEASKPEPGGPHGAGPDNAGRDGNGSGIGPGNGPVSGPGHERLLAMFCYGLFLLALANGLTMLIGVVLSYLRRVPAQGTLYESHYNNLITVFWVSFAVCVVSFALVLHGLFLGLMFLFWPNWWPGRHFHAAGGHDFGWHFFPWGWGMGWGWPMAATAIPLILGACVLYAIWYLTRVLGGFIRALDEKPY